MARSTSRLKISLVVGLLISSPLWLWQIWAFVLPAMHRNEKRWAVLLTATGAPLFVAGARSRYLLLPKAIEVLIGFVPDGFGNLVDRRGVLQLHHPHDAGVRRRGARSRSSS